MPENKCNNIIIILGFATSSNNYEIIKQSKRHLTWYPNH